MSWWENIIIPRYTSGVFWPTLLPIISSVQIFDSVFKLYLDFFSPSVLLLWICIGSLDDCLIDDPVWTKNGTFVYNTLVRSGVFSRVNHLKVLSLQRSQQLCVCAKMFLTKHFYLNLCKGQSQISNRLKWRYNPSQ